MRVRYPDRSPLRIQVRYASPTSSGFAEIVSDDFPMLHAMIMARYPTPLASSLGGNSVSFVTDAPRMARALGLIMILILLSRAPDRSCRPWPSWFGVVVEAGEHLAQHGFTASAPLETGLIVAAQRILDHVAEALVAIRTRRMQRAVQTLA